MSLWRKLGILLISIFVMGATILVSVYVTLLADLPQPHRLSAYAPRETTKFLDRHGRLLYEWTAPHPGKRSDVSLDQIPAYLQEATIATEDRSFYTHPGIAPQAILRALITNLYHGEIRSGGSTITQQVARMLLLSREERWQQTWARKIREAYLAWRLTRLYDKTTILALYLNHSYYGNMTYGVEAAAQSYFGKPVRDLDLAECAMLAGLPQSPATWNPLLDAESAAERQSTVLRLMVEAGYINAQQAELAREEPLHFAAEPLDIKAPHFVMYARQLLEARYGWEAVAKGGWQITTTLDLDMQAAAEAIIHQHLTALNDPARSGLDHNVHNAALVALDPRNGEILAMVGSPNYSDPQISGAVNGALVPRQPGSAIKPFTYAAALQANYTPATVLYDVRTVYQTAEGDPYIPINYDRAYHGPITLRHALATSSNVAAVQILNDLGLQSLLDLGHRCGLRWYGNPNKFGLALTLGGSEVRLLDLTGAYACFAAGGIRRAPKAIATIHNPAGDPIPWPKPDGERVLDERVAYLITDILADDHARLPAFGERSALFIGRPAAVKTGTTTNWRDNWTVGYTPELTVGVWLGNADNVPMRKMMGATGAAPIWHRFMGKVLADRPIIRFDSPRLVEKAVCPVTGLVSSLACPEQYYEKFVPGTEPVETCNAHRLYRIDAATGLVATALTPPSEIITRTYVSLPPQAQEWGQARGIPAPPDRIDSPSRGKDSDLLEINQPAANTRYVLDDTLPSEAQIIEFSVQWHGTRPAPAIALFLDNEPLTTWSEPPYTYPWPLRPGEHTLLARTVSKSPPVTSQLLRFYVEP